ncbi:CG7946, partial [Drosophila busckii]
MAANASAVNFLVGDLVFAQMTGYIPWPARLLDNSHERQAKVQFVLTQGIYKVTYAKLWPYNEQSKARFVTADTLAYEDFSDAMRESEQMCEGSKQKKWELDFVYELRRQRALLEVEPFFIQQVNQLRRTLTRQNQNYAAAQLAFQELLEMHQLSPLLMLRNKEAVDAIKELCRFKSRRLNDRYEAEHMRDLANYLVE